ncbi:MAG: sulfopyruvate decarboxylase subunit alpha, partial [Rhodobacteraceae bacterium]|nr:sulfopyruvate decarboxylase subunit alpha [Paracoccaceae bacterium]
MPTQTDRQIIDSLIASGISFVTSVPCKQLAGVIDLVEKSEELMHVPCNKEDEGMGLCAGAYMGGRQTC